MYHSFATAVIRSGSEDLILRTGRTAATAYAALDLAVEAIKRQISCVKVSSWPHQCCVQLWATVMGLTEEESKWLSRQERGRDAVEEAAHRMAMAEEIAKSPPIEPLVDEDGTIVVKEDPTNAK